MGEGMRSCKCTTFIVLSLTFLALLLSMIGPVYAQSVEDVKTITVVVTHTTTFIPPLGSIGVWFGLGFVTGVIIMGIALVLRSGASTAPKRAGKKRR